MKKLNMFVVMSMLMTTMYAQHEEKEQKNNGDDSKNCAHSNEHKKYESEVSVHLSKVGLDTNDFDSWEVKAWALHTLPGNKFVIDVHGGFNYEHTLNINIGYNITQKKQELFFVPKIGIMAGSHWGISLGILNEFHYKKLHVFNTCEFGFNILHKEDQLFNFIEIGYKINSCIEVGLILENKYHLYRDDKSLTDKSENKFDIGPVVKLKFDHIYFEAWYASSPFKHSIHDVFVKDSKMTLGFGWKFNENH